MYSAKVAGEFLIQFKVRVPLKNRGQCADMMCNNYDWGRTSPNGFSTTISPVSLACPLRLVFLEKSGVEYMCHYCSLSVLNAHIQLTVQLKAKMILTMIPLDWRVWRSTKGFTDIISTAVMKSPESKLS